jgi:hypothetical protein
MIAAAEASKVASRFRIEHPIEVTDFLGKGNINLDTFLVEAGPQRRSYILQRVNAEVFPMADRVMAGMLASINAQRESLLSVAGGGHGWRSLELIPTHEGQFFHGDPTDTWRLIAFIDDTVSYKSLAEVPQPTRLDTAREVGRGLAIYSDLTANIDPAAVPISLPGYRNTRLYFDLFKASLKGFRSVHEVFDLLPNDPEERAAAQQHFLCALDEEERLARKSEPEVKRCIDLALAYERLALSMQRALQRGEIRKTVIHGDTKIENFLFCRFTGRVVSLVDLDTVMPLTWLADWGDMVRSLANVAGEKETNLDKVMVDGDIYRAVLEGFLSTAATPTPEEIAWMPRAVQIITLELGVRFLADYLRGDTYFKVAQDDPKDINRTRALVQFRLFERLLQHEEEARSIVEAHLATR